MVDPDSQASRDKDFNSAFTNNPLKTWTGEVGAVILSRGHLYTTTVENPSTGLVEALEDFRKLGSLWISYKDACSDRECPVCRGNGDRSDGDSRGNDNDNSKGSDDQEEDQNRENKENKGGGHLDEEDEGG